MAVQLTGIADRLLDWSSDELAFLHQLHEAGKLDGWLLTDDPEIRRRIEAQPMLRWKALNVRNYREGRN